MLPTSKKYLTRAGFSARASAFSLIGLFLAGVVVIRIVSGLIHRHMPSHVVDCAHSHEQDSDPESGHTHAHHNSDEHAHTHTRPNGHAERAPLLQRTEARSYESTPAVVQRENHTVYQPHKEPFRFRLTRSINVLMGGVKPLCDENGPCYGFSQACGHECTKTLKIATSGDDARPLLPHNQTVVGQPDAHRDQTRDMLDSEDSRLHHVQQTEYFEVNPSLEAQQTSASSSKTDVDDDNAPDGGTQSPPKSQSGAQHHHHVPQNAFLSIGLQTVLAIALHKLPEGFITYATNHANPTLGMTVFLALFIHNITEGFAMALPLYLALHSRWKAITWSSFLGGISQPAGAALAALWIWGAQKANGGHNGDDDTVGPSWGVYGGMFAATAGVMTSVALQLFSEGLELTHNRGLGIGFAIGGMGLMGFSFALTS